MNQPLITATPQRNDPFQLSADDEPADHSFAGLSHYDGDLALLNYLLQDLRAIVRQVASGEAKPKNHEAIEWEVHGLQRRTILCDVDRLTEPTSRHMVGFFGDRRGTIADEYVDETELDVVGQFRHFPGIISYSSIELVNDQWANLVVHARTEDRDEWRHSRVHVEAAEEFAPKLYHNVRIHNGRLPGGPIGSETVVIDSTKYWNYDAVPAWHAFRQFQFGLGKVVEPVDPAPFSGE